MRDQYPILPSNKTIDDVLKWITEVTRARNSDLDDYNVQQRENPRIYNLTPASAGDLSGNEKAGDIAFDVNFIYIVVDNSGTLEWRKASLSTV